MRGQQQCHNGVAGVRIDGSSAATIGNSRMPLSVTAIAPSIADVPDASAVTTMSCAGPAQTSTVESSDHGKTEVEAVAERAIAEKRPEHHVGENGLRAGTQPAAERASGWSSSAQAVRPAWRVSDHDKGRARGTAFDNQRSCNVENR